MANEDVIKQYLYEIKVDYDEKSLDNSLDRLRESFEIFFDDIDKMFEGQRFDINIPEIKNNKFYDKSAVDYLYHKKVERKELEKMYAKMFDELDDPHGDKAKMGALPYEIEAISKIAETYRNNNILNFLTNGPKGLLTKSFYGLLALKSAKIVYKGFKQLEKTSIETSNKFIEANSMFIDRGIRDTMIKYGASSTQAIGMRKTMDILGIQDQDMLKLTGGQARAYRDLMKQYFDGMNKINPERLNYFNKGIQDYQMAMSKFKMGWQIQKFRFLSENAEILNKFFTQLGKMADILSGVMDIIRPILSVITNLIGMRTTLGPDSLIVDLLSDLKTGIGNSINNSQATQNNTYNINGGDANEVQDTISRSNQALKQMLEVNYE